VTCAAVTRARITEIIDHTAHTTCNMLQVSEINNYENKRVDSVAKHMLKMSVKCCYIDTLK